MASLRIPVSLALCVLIGLSPVASSAASTPSPSPSVVVGTTQPKWVATGDFAAGSDLTLSTTQSKTLTHKATNAPSGVRPVLQQWVNGAWADVTALTVASDGTVKVVVGKSAPLKALKGSPGTNTYLRLHWKQSAKVARAWSTHTKKVTWGKVAPQVSTQLPFGNAKKFTVNSKTPRSYTFTTSEHVKTVRVQRQTGKNTWVTSRSISPTSVKNGRATFKLPLTTREAGSTQQFRFHVPEQKAVSQWYGPIQSVTYPKLATKLTSSLFPQLTLISSTGGQSVSAHSNGEAGRQIQLQQYVNKKWVTKSTKKTDSKGRVTVSLPKLAHKKKATYRLHAPATSSRTAATLKSVNVSYSDPRKATGMAKQLRDAMKSKCPHATVSLTGKAKFKGWAASAWGNQNRVVLYSKLNKNRSDYQRFFKYIAHHECAHILTYQAAQKSGITDIQARLNKLFGTSGNMGVEQMADAVATAWSGNSKNNSYKKSFTKAQMNAAKKILNGKWY